MIVTLSDRLIADRIRRMEGLDADTTSEELFAQQHLFSRFRKYLSDAFHIEVEEGTARPVANSLARFRVHLHTDDLNKIAAGLDVLKPLSVSLEREDLPRLGAPLLANGNNWKAVEPHLKNLSLPLVNVIDAIEAVSWKLLRNSREALPAKYADFGFEVWAERNGLPTTIAKNRQEQESDRDKIAAAEAAQVERERYLEERERDTDHRWHIREI